MNDARSIERTCCDGMCTQGRDCPRRPIRSVESEHKWLWVAYVCGVAAGIGGSAIARALS